MFRRRLFWPVRRPIVRGALVGGFGYLLGRRAAGRQSEAAVGQGATASSRLDELEALHGAGKLTDAEYEAKRSEILRDL